MVMLKLHMAIERNNWSALWIVLGAMGLLGIIGFATGANSSNPSTPTNYTDSDEPDAPASDPDRVAQLEQDFNEGVRP